MMRVVFVCVMILIIQNGVFGQHNFLPGYYITNTGDSVAAEIDDRKWPLNPDKVRIRNNGEIAIYNIDSLKGFGIINGDTYQRFVVEKHTDADNYRKAFEGLTNEVVSDTVWLRKVWKSGCSLWILEDDFRKWFYVETATKEMVELVYRVRLSKGAVQELNEFKQYLRELGKASGKEAEADKLLANTKYTQSSLISYLKNICGSAGEKSSKNAKLKSFIDAGVSVVQATFQNESPNSQGNFANAIFDKQTQFIPQIGFGFTGDRGLSHWVASIRVGYRNITSIGNVLSTNQGPSDFSTQYRFKANYFQTQFSVQYSPITGLNVQPYIGLMAELNVRLGVKEHFAIVYNGDISNELYRLASVPNYGKAISQFGAKAGVFIKRIVRVEGGYYFTANMLSGTNQQISTASQSLMLKGFSLSAYVTIFGAKSLD